LRQGGKRARFSEKGKPSRGISLGVKESEGVSAADELIPDFDITPHAAENFDVGQKGGDFQCRKHHRFILIQNPSLTHLPRFAEFGSFPFCVGSGRRENGLASRSGSSLPHSAVRLVSPKPNRSSRSVLLSFLFSPTTNGRKLLILFPRI